MSLRRLAVIAALVATVVAQPPVNGMESGPPTQTGVPAQAIPRADIVIRHARVIHGDGRVTPSATVVIRAGLITDVHPTGMGFPAPGDPPARVEIDATGRSVMPGLIDAHVHLAPWSLAMFLERGVTAVRDLHNRGDYVFPLAAREDSGRPHVVASGPILDMPGGQAGTALVVETVGDARSAVRSLVEAGARVIKVSPRVGPALFSVIVSEARARGVPVAAHLGATTALQAADAGVTSIEHASGVVESTAAASARIVAAHADFFAGWTAAELEWRNVPLQRLEEVARELTARGVVLVPTLAAHEATFRLTDADLTKNPDLAGVPAEVRDGTWKPSDVMARARWTPSVLAQFRQAFPILQQFVGTYARVGGRVVTGSDVGQAFVIPGVSLHRELELLVACGLSTGQAITAATSDAAALLGVQDRMGTIDTGKVADLVLVEGNPLTDIRMTRRIVTVIKDGVVVTAR